MGTVLDENCVFSEHYLKDPHYFEWGIRRPPWMETDRWRPSDRALGWCTAIRTHKQFLLVFFSQRTVYFHFYPVQTSMFGGRVRPHCDYSLKPSTLVYWLVIRKRREGGVGIKYLGGQISLKLIWSQQIIVSSKGLWTYYVRANGAILDPLPLVLL